MSGIFRNYTDGQVLSGAMLDDDFHRSRFEFVEWWNDVHPSGNNSTKWVVTADQGTMNQNYVPNHNGNFLNVLGSRSTGALTGAHLHTFNRLSFGPSGLPSVKFAAHLTGSPVNGFYRAGVAIGSVVDNLTADPADMSVINFSKAGSVYARVVSGATTVLNSVLTSSGAYAYNFYEIRYSTPSNVQFYMNSALIAQTPSGPAPAGMPIAITQDNDANTGAAAGSFRVYPIVASMGSIVDYS